MVIYQFIISRRRSYADLRSLCSSWWLTIDNECGTEALLTQMPGRGFHWSWKIVSWSNWLLVFVLEQWLGAYSSRSLSLWSSRTGRSSLAASRSAWKIGLGDHSGTCSFIWHKFSASSCQPSLNASCNTSRRLLHLGL